MLRHLGLLLVACLGLFCSTHAQTLASDDAPVRIELRVNPLLTEAQALSLATLGINTSGRGQELFEIIIQNTSGTLQTDLYLRIEVYASRFGKIAEVYSARRQPITLQPAQVIIANNNNLEVGVPGIPPQSLVAALTTEGENFVNSLEGSSAIPDDIYTTKVFVFRGSPFPGEGQLLASAEEVVGARPIQNSVDFELLQPGGPVGGGDLSVSVTPAFRWDGPIDQRYRLIVVEDFGQSPLSLLQGAQSTEAVLGSGAAGSRLLEFEMVDALIQGTSWQYPVSGVRPLQPGSRYFWQIFALIQTATGVQERPSSIFEFTVPDGGNPGEFQTANQESTPVVLSISPELGAELVALIERGYEITSVEVDGIRYSGASVLTVLEEFANGIRSGEITIVTP